MMAENSRKRCRKSKLVPRECVDLVEDPELQEPPQKKLLLEKIKKEPNDFIPQSFCPDTHKFSVEVEIEDMDTTAPEEDAPDYMKYLFSLSKESQETEPRHLEFADNSLLLEQKLVIPLPEEDGSCLVNIKKLQKMLTVLHRTYPKEKEVVMHCRNQWGRVFHERCPTEFKKLPQQVLLQDVLRRWKEWTMVSRSKESPYCYKCYICNNGWWTYIEFITHVIQHPHCKFQIQTRHLECDVVAYDEESPGIRDIEIHGKCTKCAKTYDHHMTNKRSTDSYYYCNYCNERFQTCRTLAKHEGTCHRNPIRDLAKTKAGKDYSFSDYSCPVCNTVYLSKRDLEEHLTICHKVRSDEPIVTIFKKCKDCEQNYYNFFTHICLKKNYINECPHCFRKFQNKQMLENHVKLWDKVAHCGICDKYLVKCCMAAEHYALHSEEFLLVYRCLVCRKIKVFVTEEALRVHSCRYHKKFDARRPKIDRIIMPRIMLQECLVEPVKKGVPKLPQKPTSEGTGTGGHHTRETRLYVPVPVNSKKTGNNEVSHSNNTTIAHDDTVSMRPEVPSVETPVQIKQEKEDVTENVQVSIKTPEIVNPVCTKIPGISVVKIKIEKKDDEDIEAESSIEKIPSAEEVSSKIQKIKTEGDVKNISNIMEELTEFLDIKPDVVKEEKISDDEAAQATKELTNLLQMSNNDDATKVFQASTTFAASIQAEEVTDNSEHSTVFQISQTILEASIKQELEPEVIVQVSPNVDPIDASPNQSVSETSDLSVLNLEPEVILKAGYRKRKTYKCNRCHFTGYHREYKEHVKNLCGHQGINKEFTSDVIYTCTKCEKGFVNLKKYALHFDKHGYAYMSCPQCSQQFESVTKLMSHINSHLKAQFLKVRLIDSCEDDSKKVYQCKNCAVIVESEKWFEHWEKHLVLKVAEEKKAPLENIKVGQWGERSLNPDSLKQCLVILTKTFTNESRHAKACCVCARVFERKNDTKRHLIEHLLEDAYANLMTNQMLKCQICNDLHMKADAYKKHMRDHANLPIYQCDLCNKTFSDSSNFTKHKKIHNLKAYICDICSKKFQAKMSLEKHIHMHLETDPINCAQCDRVFYDRSFYRRHCRQHHNKEATKFRCILCREKFASLREKWDHLWEVHKQRKEAADCPICGESYRKFVDVKKHAYEKHGKSVTMSTLWSLLSKEKSKEKETEVSVKEEEDSDDDCLLIEEEPETLVVYD